MKGCTLRVKFVFWSTPLKWPSARSMSQGVSFDVTESFDVIYRLNNNNDPFVNNNSEPFVVVEAMAS